MYIFLVNIDEKSINVFQKLTKSQLIPVREDRKIFEISTSN